jgi:hypothetical protein
MSIFNRYCEHCDEFADWGTLVRTPSKKGVTCYVHPKYEPDTKYTFKPCAVCVEEAIENAGKVPDWYRKQLNGNRL